MTRTHVKTRRREHPRYDPMATERTRREREDAMTQPVELPELEGETHPSVGQDVIETERD